MSRLLFFLFLSFISLIGYAASSETTINTGLNILQIKQLTGEKGELDNKENVFKISSPRDDLKININGVKVTPAMGLTSWAAFKRVNNHVIVMGDLVLLEDQLTL